MSGHVWSEVWTAWHPAPPMTQLRLKRVLLLGRTEVRGTPDRLEWRWKYDRLGLSGDEARRARAPLGLNAGAVGG